VGKKLLIVSRVQTMTPTNSLNLNRFLDSYSRMKSYSLTYALPPSGRNPPQVSKKPWIVKSHLHVVEAWKIGINDLECTGLREDDAPIIPPDQADAPVLQVLQRKQERR
jgi:hypothetical protein